jgi:diaminohydroxyphosphoribosylaminopyrimidine deaminase / 5-amino-6-(5-phosphoribosylamino)uracil reductase
MDDDDLMRRALELGADVRRRTSPNPWVGCVIRCTDGQVFEGATEEPGQRHAERVALDHAIAAGADLRGATVVCTLEPCSHTGRTPPCADALVDAGVGRVVTALLDPDPRVRGRGVLTLRTAGIDVAVGVQEDEAERQLAPYLHHRRTGRPYVVLKLAATLDGRVAAADGTSQWITGPDALRAAHQLRADSDAVLVGAGTVRTDNPSLTTRLVEGPSPRRVVLGEAPADAQVQPCLQWDGPIDALLDHLGGEGVLQLLVEGGARVAASFHQAHLVDRYVFYLAPALMGGNDGMALLHGETTPTISQLWRGTVTGLRRVGVDIEIIVEPQRYDDTTGTPREDPLT